MKFFDSIWLTIFNPYYYISEWVRTGIRYWSVYKKKKNNDTAIATQKASRTYFVIGCYYGSKKNHIAIVWKVQGHRFQRWKEKHVEELEALKRRDNTTGNNPSGDEII